MKTDFLRHCFPKPTRTCDFKHNRDMCREPKMIMQCYCLVLKIPRTSMSTYNYDYNYDNYNYNNNYESRLFLFF